MHIHTRIGWLLLTATQLILNFCTKNETYIVVYTYFWYTSYLYYYVTSNVLVVITIQDVLVLLSSGEDFQSQKPMEIPEQRRCIYMFMCMHVCGGNMFVNETIICINAVKYAFKSSIFLEL